MSRLKVIVGHPFVILCLCLLLAACGGDDDSITPTPESVKPAATEPTTEVTQKQQVPPAPPIHEDFQGEPQLSLFARVGDYRPEDDNTERMPFWKTFIDHLQRISGVVQSADNDNRAWSFHSIDTIDSLGFFSPLAVEPATTYRVGFRMKTELPEGGSAGVGILEFNEFLWVGDQYPESLYKEHYRGTQEGVRLTGDVAWEEHEFTFTTGQETKMIHLVLFRDGIHDRKPVLFDDIEIRVSSGP